MNALEQLSAMTVVVADTGDVGSIETYHPTDATTNPSLLFQAAQTPSYQHIIEDALTYSDDISLVLDKLAVNVGVQILQIVPGVVSTEVDARLSFDTAATVAKGRSLIELYRAAGIPKERILIKIASTWEGLQACRILEAEGIHVNMTLMFSLAQAAVAADANATLISPFVGRILDWHKEHGYDAKQEDPGVVSVRQIYGYYKQHGYKTIVMGASFRNIDEIIELAGCDKLTISPSLLEKLKHSDAKISRKLNPVDYVNSPITPLMDCSESAFRWALNEDAMATEKLAEGIRKFASDTVKLEKLVMSLKKNI